MRVMSNRLSLQSKLIKSMTVFAFGSFANALFSQSFVLRLSNQPGCAPCTDLVCVIAESPLNCTTASPKVSMNESGVEQHGQLEFLLIWHVVPS